MTLQGISTVARQEFRLRIRAGRWRLLLGAWCVLLALFTLLLRLAAGSVPGLQDRGTLIYGGLTLVVLGLSLLVAPSLAAQSVNGDRERGTLATLQVTRLSAAEIALGKFAAAWGTALLFLALTLPFALYAVTQGGVPLGRLVVVTLVLALLLGSVCAIALCLSAVLPRSTASGLLAYVVVAALTIGTVMAFGLATALTSERYPITVQHPVCEDEDSYSRYAGPDAALPAGCTLQTDSYQGSRARTDRTWWLLAPNPFVVLADAAPTLQLPSDPYDPGLTEQQQLQQQQARDLDPLGSIGRGVRELRREPVPLQQHIEQESSGTFVGRPEQPAGARVWPYGLAFDVLLAGGALALTVRRLRTPSRSLPRGQRVA